MLKSLQDAPLDWATLTQQAAPYTALAATTDPVSGLVDVSYCGLKTTLSAVMQGQAAGAHGVAIFADTLVIDMPALATAGLLLVVRELDVTALNGAPLMLTPPANGQVMAQALVGTVTGGSFRLGVTGLAGEIQPPLSGGGPPQASTWIAAKNEPLSQLPSTSGGGLTALLGYSWSMNSLYASFAAGSWLMEDLANAGSQSVAQAMLAWVVNCTAGLTANNQLPSNCSELYNQAAALLVTLNLAPGATYVPALSPIYYSQHMGDVLSVLRDYEAKMSTLDTRGDIAAAIATVSASLQSVAGSEIVPLQVQLDNINQNTQSLFNDISDLRAQFQLQNQRAHTAFLVLGTEITVDSIKQQISALFDMAMSGISLGFDGVKMAAGDPDGLKSAIEDSVNGIKSIIETVEAAKQAGMEDLTSTGTTLLNGQIALMNTVLNGRLLWQQALDNQSGGVLPTSLAAITVDPVTDWDNYMISAEAEITSLQRDIGGDALPAADKYLASLKILAGYGKAIGAKFVAYVGQLVQATVVLAQIKAAKDAQARWQATQANASSVAEQLAALRAMIQSRSQATKRSLYVAWTYYAASYFYLNFNTPPRTVHMDMDAAALNAALVGVSEWVAAAVGNAPDGQRIQLPSQNATITLDYAILAKDQAPVGDVALLDASADGGWSLTFTLPMGSEQLNGVLPNNGRCAIWISDAQFFLDGVTANGKGNVIASVSTSGAYQNGTDPAQSHTFVSKGMIGDYAYRVADGKVYSPWAINTAVYMTPTPYTQWNLRIAAGNGDLSTATRLRVNLTIAYLS
ncbi:MAG: hypothetical protein V4631_08855 [Pseudomonadota bacterium]